MMALPLVTEEVLLLNDRGECSWSDVMLDRAHDRNPSLTGNPL